MQEFVPFLDDLVLWRKQSFYVGATGDMVQVSICITGGKSAEFIYRSIFISGSSVLTDNSSDGKLFGGLCVVSCIAPQITQPK